MTSPLVSFLTGNNKIFRKAQDVFNKKSRTDLVGLWRLNVHDFLRLVWPTQSVSPPHHQGARRAPELLGEVWRAAQGAGGGGGGESEGGVNPSLTWTDTWLNQCLPGFLQVLFSNYLCFSCANFSSDSQLFNFQNSNARYIQLLRKKKWQFGRKYCPFSFE